MSTSAVERWTAHARSCERCRTARRAVDYCTPGWGYLQLARQEAAEPRRSVTPLVATLLMYLGLFVIGVAVVLLLNACAPAAPTPIANPELVQVILQTEQSVQVQHGDDAIEVVRADGWPQLATPVEVCASFTGPLDTVALRMARLWDRSACGGP